MAGKYEREQRLWRLIHQMHLYPTNDEAIFKCFGMVLTWGGTVFINLINGTIVSQDTLILFALGMLLEYTGKFVSKENSGRPTQILPGILFFANALIYFFEFIQIGSQFTNNHISNLIYNSQIGMTCVTIFIIIVDTFLKICEYVPPDGREKRIEHHLKNT